MIRRKGPEVEPGCNQVRKSERKGPGKWKSEDFGSPEGTHAGANSAGQVGHRFFFF